METTPLVSPVPTSSNSIESILSKYPIIMQLLRFAAIGFLNTGLSFVVANLVSKYFGYSQGTGLGLSSGVGFVLATIQSYYWNRYWAFGGQTLGLMKNLVRLVVVGLLGVVTLGFVYVGSKGTAPYYYYIILLVVFFLVQLIMWHSFKLMEGAAATNPMLAFFIVSIIGFLINYFIASQFSSAVHLLSNPDLNKNLALVAATCVSLIWNFVGYKLIVFKK